MLPAAPAAASRFIVPITLTSCRARPLSFVESTIRWVCTIVSTRVALTMRSRIENDESARTYSVCSSGSTGSRVSSADDELDRRIGLEASARAGCPKNVPMPVRRIRISRTRRCAGPQQIVERPSWIDDRIRSDWSMTTLRL